MALTFAWRINMDYTGALIHLVESMLSRGGEVVSRLAQSQGKSSFAKRSLKRCTSKILTATILNIPYGNF